MRVIDWEYGGMNGGYYDIACVCVENPLDARCEDVFFRAYCGGEPSEEAKARPADQQVPGDLPLVYLVAGSDLLRQGRGLLLGVRPYPCSPGMLLPGRPQLFQQPDPAGRLTGRRGSPWNSSERLLPIS